MFKFFSIGIVILSLSGCASVKYTTPNGESFSYRRLGIQKLDGFNLSKDEKGIVSVGFTKQEGGENIMESLKNISEIAVTALKKVP